MSLTPVPSQFPISSKQIRLQNGGTPHCTVQILNAMFHADELMCLGVFYDDDAVLYGLFSSS